MSTGDRNLVLWAGCVVNRGLPARAEAAVAGGFSCMSILCGDLLAHERDGGSLRDLARELEARGAPVPILDPFLAWYPGWAGSATTGAQADSQNVDLDTVMRYAEEIGARSLSVLTPFEGTPAPREEVLDALGGVADRAAAIGLRLHLEVIPTSMTPDLAAGWDLVQGVARDNVGLVLDTFHLGRSGCTPEELSAIPADRIFHVQLCDAPVQPRIDDYFEEAVTIRDFAGDGELGILELSRSLEEMGALGNVGPEVFSAELDAMGAAEAGRLCRAKTDRFLAEVEDAYERSARD
jgi:sugar phosphate isomerase/epimerase